MLLTSSLGFSQVCNISTTGPVITPAVNHYLASYTFSIFYEASQGSSGSCSIKNNAATSLLQNGFEIDQRPFYSVVTMKCVGGGDIFVIDNVSEFSARALSSDAGGCTGSFKASFKLVPTVDSYNEVNRIYLPVFQKTLVDKNLKINTTTAIPVIQIIGIKKPLSTCSASISPKNLTLGTISKADLSGAVGSFTTAGQQPFSISMTCGANVLSQSTTFVPTFTFGKTFAASAFDIAISDKTDLGFGFRLISPSNTGIRSGARLSTDTYSFTTPAVSQTIDKTFMVQYAKSLSTISTGSISSTIVVTIDVQ